ncbi:MAG: DUF4139 domain-containing protein [Treponema sp.]|nr:DUF4139 domain-containing protein [Treponema sp.]
MKKCTGLWYAVFLAAVTLNAQSPAGPPGEAGLPVRRIALFSSGMGYFEHSGSVSGNGEFTLSFDLEAVDDALKSLVINDPSGASPSVSYPSEETLERTLQSLGIDLSGHPGTAEIFAAQRGAELEVSAPNPVGGRIVGVEYRSIPSPENGSPAREAYLSLHTGEGIRIIALREIRSFAFKDPSLNGDLTRALDLIALNRTTETRNLRVQFSGGGSRQVSLSYVVSVPVWKVSYRLDLGQSKPLFQGWAIIDNNSGADWNGVELSLVSGRPVSFIQRLYPPYYLDRPTLPLAIAGTARARSHAAGYGRDDDKAYSEEESLAEPAYDGVMREESFVQKSTRTPAAAPIPLPGILNRIQASAGGSAAGDQFSYRIKNPVTLPRRQSAMIPLVEGNMGASKTLLLSGSRALAGAMHPELAAELTNTTGMKLPAGPITVFDGGTYAGDALIEFFSEQDRRLITYGEDLSVTASAIQGVNRRISAVTISAGVMTINRRQIHERIYTARNASTEAKRLIIEHPVTGGAVLLEPKNYLEKTDSLYRFVHNLPAGGEITLKVEEETPLTERITLTQIRLETFISYSSNQEIPQPVRTALARAVELRQKADGAKQALADLETRRGRLFTEQERIRQNLGAVGASSDLGREYMKRMTALDGDIEGVHRELEAAGSLVKSSQKDVDDYIGGLKL